MCSKWGYRWDVTGEHTRPPGRGICPWGTSTPPLPLVSMGHGQGRGLVVNPLAVVLGTVRVVVHPVPVPLAVHPVPLGDRGPDRVAQTRGPQAIPMLKCRKTLRNGYLLFLMCIHLSRPSQSHDKTAPHIFNTMFAMNPKKATNATRRSRGAAPPPDPHLVLLLVGVDQGPLAVHLPIVDLAGVQHRACGGKGGRAPLTRGLRCVVPREEFDAGMKSEEQDLKTRTRAEFDFQDLESVFFLQSKSIADDQPSTITIVPSSQWRWFGTFHRFPFQWSARQGRECRTHRFQFIHIIGSEYDIPAVRCYDLEKRSIKIVDTCSPKKIHP